jgi:chromosome partitioning protein
MDVAVRAKVGVTAEVGVEVSAAVPDGWAVAVDETRTVAVAGEVAVDVGATVMDGATVPPAITVAIQSVIAVAELIVVPTRPSPHDLRAVGATVDLCERAGKPLIFVVNGATPKARITSEAAVALSQHGTVAPVTLHHRTDFAASMIDGRTVMEVDPKGRSAAEVTALWTYISERLEKNFRRTVFAVPQTSTASSAMPGAHRPAGGFGRRVVGS